MGRHKIVSMTLQKAIWKRSLNWGDEEWVNLEDIKPILNNVDDDFVVFLRDSFKRWERIERTEGSKRRNLLEQFYAWFKDQLKLDEAST